MRNGQYVNELKTKKRGVFLRRDSRNLSVEFWVVRWEGENHESRIAKSLTIEGQWNYCPTKKKLLPVGV